MALTEVNESLERYGWAPDDEKRRTALFRWMQETTREIERQRAEIDKLGEWILKLAELQQQIVNAAQKDADNLDKLIQLVRGK